MAVDVGRARQLIRSPVAWQRVLHGEHQQLREVVFERLVADGADGIAFRYALCGLGDVVVKSGDGVCVSPRGCGHRLCPRCGRRRGAKHARKVIGWLARAEHGDIWSVVLTQRVRAMETLTEARKRMEAKHRKYMRWATRAGMIAGISSVHIVWSKEQDGWHYHVHILAEFPPGTMSKECLIARMFDGWSDVAGDKSEAVRLVVAGGGALVELDQDAGEMDLWCQSESAVVRAVQYPVRDMCQGVSGWRLGGDVERITETVEQLYRVAKGWKLTRCWGRWRQEPPARPVDAAGEAEGAEDGASDAPGPKAEGTVFRLYMRARQGDQWCRELFRALERTVYNNGEFGKRFVAFCRFAWSGPVMKGCPP